MRLLRALLLPCMLMLSFGVTAASAVAEEEAAPTPTIYKWIDENGVAHYTTDVDRIPRSLRGHVGRRAPSEPQAGAHPSPTPSATGQTAIDRTTTDTPSETTTAISEPGFGRDARAKTTRDPSDEGDTEEALDRVSDLDAQIARLEEEIAADEGTLTALVTESSGELASGDAEADLLRDLGDRLPRLLAELEALRSEREALAP